MSDEEKEDEKPFAVERAKSGRAKCKKCKCPIEKDTVRIAKLMANPFGEGKMKAWHHLSCLFEVFAKQRASTKRVEDPEEDVSGWEELCEEDKKIILQKIEEFENSCPFKTPKTANPTPKKRKPDASPKRRSKNQKAESRSNDEESMEDEKSRCSKDDAFIEFQRLCDRLSKVDAYTEKTAIVRKLFTNGTEGEGFKSDRKLWCRMLLPGVAKRVYNLQSKQLVKLFARLLLQDEDRMLEHLEQGDIAETIRTFYEKSAAVKPAVKSVLTMQEVDQFLERLSFLTKEEEQINHFRSMVSRCTGNDLKMIIRLIKHDLRINAGPKHVLSAIHEQAYEGFQLSRDLDSVVERFSEAPSGPKTAKASSSSSSRVGKVTLSLMTPVLPMLAEACKSVEMAMKKCSNGMLSEVKYDGERVQVHKRGNEFRYFSRSLKPVLAHKVNHFKEYIPKAFPDCDDLILDAEVLMIDTKTGQPLPFGSLGIHKKAEFKDANVCLFVFDCIYYNGDVLLHRSMAERRKILQERMTEIPNRIKLSEVQEVSRPQDLAKMIAKVLSMGLEGLVLKDVTGKYEPGKRHWLKVKKDYLFDGAMADTADLVVLGAWYGTGNKGGMMSIFLMGCYDEEQGNWVTVTKVHTGHDDATLIMLQDELDMIKIGKDPNKVPRWLRANKPMIPDFVARDPEKQPVWEITGAEFTNQGVHTADGISIRFPRVTKIRRDKDWSTATNLNELRRLFKNSSESIDFSLLLSSDIKKEQVNDNESKPNIDRKSKSPIKRNNDSRSMRSRSPSTSAENSPGCSKTSSSSSSSFSSSKKTIDEEKTNAEDAERAEFYAFVDKDYIEYTGDGTPLNWVEGRKPEQGLPSNAKPLRDLTDDEVRSKSILKGVPVGLSASFKKRKRKELRKLLKTLGARILRDDERNAAMYVVHPCKEIPSSGVQLFEDTAKTARHVFVSWLESSASGREMQAIEKHAVELAPDYCSCPCSHR